MQKVVLASTRYKFTEGKSETVDLTLTSNGHSGLAKVAKTSFHVTLVATVKGRRNMTKSVIVS